MSGSYLSLMVVLALLLDQLVLHQLSDGEQLVLRSGGGRGCCFNDGPGVSQTVR